MQGELKRFRDVIASGESKQIAEAFAKAQIERDNYLVAGAPSRETREEIETVSLGDMLMGSRIKEYMKKQEAIIRAQEDRAKNKR
jgi:hypothetical protein